MKIAYPTFAWIWISLASFFTAYQYCALSAAADGQITEIVVPRRNARSLPQVTQQPRDKDPRQEEDAEQRKALAEAFAKKRQIDASLASAARAQTTARIFLANPQLHSSFVTAYSANIKITYGPLLTRLLLSERQIEEFTRILTKQREALSDLQVACEAKGLLMSDPAIRALDQQRIDDRESSLMALLGEEGLIQYHEYLTSIPLRERIGDFTEGLALHGLPLDATQVEVMVRSLALHPIWAAVKDGNRVDPTEDTFTNALAPIIEVLRPEQIAPFKALWESQKARAMVFSEAARSGLLRQKK